jgi:peptide/nickel transport system permease protein
MSYLARRAGLSVLHILAVAVLAFGLSAIAPGDVVSEAAMAPGASRTALNRMRQAIFQADFGTSLSYGMPVTTLLAPRVGRTLQVVLPAWVASWTLGLMLAFASVKFRFWKPLEAIAASLQLVPEAILASLLTWVLLVYWRIDADSILLTILPVILGLTPAIVLHSAGALAAAQESRFVLLATRAGFKNETLWRRHLAPAIANPLISLIGPTLVAAFGSSLVVEAVTGWPGLGGLFLDAFKSRDYPVTQAVLILLGSTLTIVNLLADLLLYRLDPRIRLADRLADERSEHAEN